MDSISTLTFESKRSAIPASHLRRTYEARQALYQAQPPEVQSLLKDQALALAQSLSQKLPQAHFILPDQVLCDGSKAYELKTIPADMRQQKVGGLVSRLRRSTLLSSLGERLAALETFQDQAVATGAALLRYATAIAMVESLLPSGRSVRYQPAPGEEIPDQPVENEADTRAPSADPAPLSQGPNEEPVPYVTEALRFYLPQWVAVDSQGRLLVNTINEAQACVASMQNYMALVRAAAILAPYILADAEYQHKRYGIMGQLVNQGRALARFETDEIIKGIWQRVKNGKLNRGLSVSLPYFDDQDMQMKDLDFVVIPPGRIMFAPAFLVLSVCEVQARVSRADEMTPSTRQHLLAELKALEKAFDISN